MISSVRQIAVFVSCSLSMPLLNAQTNSIELGAGYSSEDSYRFGQYSGITSSGGFGVGSFNLQGPTAPENPTYWNVRGYDIGLETASLSATYDQQGSHSVYFNFDQLPHYRYNDGKSPLVGSGKASQTLPSNWIGSDQSSGFTVLSDSLKEVNLDTRREKYTGGFEWQLDRAWQLMGEFRHETKKGNESLGAIFGDSGGNPRGLMVARPVDYQTDEITVGLSYASQATQYNFSYSAMLFSNDDKALRFANPFNNQEWEAGANFDDGAIGQLGLEPDNTSHQMAFSAAHTFGSSTRLSGSLVSTRLEQDDNYLPYSSVFDSEFSLPRTDLDGKVNSLVGAIGFSTRLGRQTTLRLRFNYRDRDNKTPRDNYQRIPGDTIEQHPLISESTRVNRIYDLERIRYSADITYRLGGRNRLSGGFELEETDRSMVDVATTDETSGYLKLDFSPTVTSNGWLKVSRSERNASAYDSTVPFVTGHNPDYVATLVGNQLFENDPFLRRYHLSERDRDEVSGSLNFFPSDVVGLSLLGKYSTNDYPKAVVGISKSDNKNLAADLSLSPDKVWKASLYYNYDQFDNQNRGYTRLGFPFNTPFYPQSARNPDLNWIVETRDKVHSYGAGVDWELMQGRLQLSLDASYSDAETATNPNSGNAFLPIPGVTADDPFPDVTTEILSFSLRGDYQLRPGRELSIRYYYEDYDSADWALDDIRVDSVANMLMLGNQSFNYSGNLIIVSLIVDLN